ncbi:unnamed protein product [Blepharisma stoltei]|uniref:Uncharacterized protein n=1 Tax=Blepharisma stoltei TaxID=1481888 RepID=A0AAU9KDD9_9CILI|nr:unnamed protein product [Blepharisma stoltei]
MFEALYKIPEIKEFLACFPKEQWKGCIEASIVLGIRWTISRFPNGCTYSQLKAEAKSNFQWTQKKASASWEEHYKPNRNSFSTAKVSESQLQKENRKYSKTMNQQKIPNRLKCVSSKIKDQVHRDIALYKFKMNSSRNSLIEKSAEIEKINSGVQTERVSLPINAVDDFIPHINYEDFSSPNYSESFRTKNKRKQKKFSITEEIKEPNTLSIEDAQDIFTHITNGKDSPLKARTNGIRLLDIEKNDKSVVGIADRFLNNPMASYLSKEKGSISGLHSPKFIERLLIPSSNPTSRPETTSPSYLINF